MTPWPSGTITFLFTDIEGSTKLWDRSAETMNAARLRHLEIITGCVERHQGVFVRTRMEGDSTFSVFSSAADAVAAACELQRALSAESWPSEISIQVRAALHTGEAYFADGDYNSTDVNRCARLRAIAHGGQTLVSEATWSASCDSLPADVMLRDMGVHALKDLRDPEHVWQIVHPELREAFPPLLSLDTFPNNLPRLLTSFVGRSKEMSEVRGRLTAAPLVTLVGAGGTGKTRLALQIATESLEDYTHGVWFVELAALNDPAMVNSALAGVLGLREEAGRPIVDTIVSYVGSRSILIVLDNCEHLPDACAPLARMLLNACPNLRILATSRTPLGVDGGVSYPIHPLPVPPAGKAADGEESDVASYDSVKLFLERAQSVRTDFTIIPNQLNPIARICRQLDGIPLALELAAARVRVMTPEQIADRLSDRFRLLTGGSRTALPRQQTLRATIDWSYDLLRPIEQRLLRWLSVFSGGWTLQHVEELWAGLTSQNGDEIHLNAWEALDLLTELVDKSLVVRDEAGDRFRMLETIRWYGADRLHEAGEREEVEAWHRGHFQGLASETAPRLRGAEQAIWLSTLEVEHDNLRAALESWKRMNPIRGLGMATDLASFWEIRGHLTEGRNWLEGLVEKADESSVERTNALNSAGKLAWFQGDYTAATRFHSAARDLAQGGSSPHAFAAAQAGLADVAYAQGDYPAAILLHQSSLEIRKRAGDDHAVATSLLCLGNIAWVQSEFGLARDRYEESLELFRRLGDMRSAATVLACLAGVEYDEGDVQAAREYDAQCLQIQRGLGDTINVAVTLHNMAESAMHTGELETARELYSESLKMLRDLGSRQYTACALEGFAKLEMVQGDSERAARLYGGATAIREAVGAPVPPNARAEYEESVERLRGLIEPATFEKRWQEGLQAPEHQAIAYALRSLEWPETKGAVKWDVRLKEK